MTAAEAQDVVYEALCSAFYQMPFAEFLGEKDLKEPNRTGRTGWFHLGDAPKDMRVEIHRPEKRDAVEVRFDWRNYHADPRNPLRGSQTVSISTYAATQAILMQPVQDAVVRALEIYQDVLSETGVAGEISKLVEHDDTEGDDE